MREDEVGAFVVGAAAGFLLGIAILVAEIRSSEAIVKSMQKAAIERGAAEWKDDDGKPVFTWKEIK